MAEVATLGDILVVDDDQGVRDTLTDFLEMEGYAVRQAANVAQAQNQLKSTPDLVLLDLNMPGGDGLTLAAEIRARTSTPIIIISGKGGTIDKVVGLEVGADDYLSKPFELRELLARVRAVLRRTTPTEAAGTGAPVERVARFGGCFQLNPGRRLVSTVAGEPIDLTGAEFNLLHALVERSNRVMSRDAIADMIQKGEPTAFDRSIDTLVSRLRRKLAVHTDAAKLVQTVRGQGYILASHVEWTGAKR